MVVLSDLLGPVPSGYNLLRRDYRLCVQYEGTPPVSSSVTMGCNSSTSGRTLYIYVAASSRLAICEVEVYGRRKSDINTVKECSHFTQIVPMDIIEALTIYRCSNWTSFSPISVSSRE